VGIAAGLKARVPKRHRRRLARTRVALRSHLPMTRTLPDLLVIGAQRAGTSSLYKYLETHPDVLPSLRKETEYFTLFYGLGEEWYRAHFPTTARMKMRRRSAVVFEATPYYLFHPMAAARAAAVVPDARLVVLLRNPVDRAYSHWHHEVRGGREPLAFEDALDAEQERIGADHERLLVDPDYVSRRHHRYSYVARGRYADQLERWLAHYPRQRFVFVRSEDLYADPPQTYRRLLDDLGLEPSEPREFRNHSYAAGPRQDGPPMSPSVRARLQATFAEDNARLAALTGLDLGWS
jgi:hypothetical protein